jgi:hypothetical protein
MVRLVTGEKGASLVGDLIEQHRHGRSASWYWRQALTAIAVVAAADIRANKALTIRAVVVGFACMWASSSLARFALQILWALSSGGVYVDGHWISLSYGWIRSPRYLGLVLTSMGSAGSGWIVGRLHREHQAPMVFAFLTAAVVAATAQLVLQVRLVGWVIRPLFPGRYPLAVLLFFVSSVVSILVGGLWGAGQGQSNRTPSKTHAVRIVSR